MRKQSLPTDPFSLSAIGIGTWMTSLMVAWKFAEAFSEQTTLMTRASHGPIAPPAARDRSILLDGLVAREPVRAAAHNGVGADPH
jgi:hypothetical protein